MNICKFFIEKKKKTLKNKCLQYREHCLSHKKNTFLMHYMKLWRLFPWIFAKQTQIINHSVKYVIYWLSIIDIRLNQLEDCLKESYVNRYVIARLWSTNEFNVCTLLNVLEGQTLLSWRKPITPHSICVYNRSTILFSSEKHLKCRHCSQYVH